MDTRTYLAGCPFCAISSGLDSSIEKICEANTWVAFFPDDPATLGHTLIIPRWHAQDYWSVDRELAADLAIGVQIVGEAIRSIMRPQGMNLITSSGSAAEQSVFHAHLHVVPRWDNDRIGTIWPPKVRMSERVKHEVAAELRTACDQGLARGGTSTSGD